jgi:hypothetical protein
MKIRDIDSASSDVGDIVARREMVADSGNQQKLTAERDRERGKYRGYGHDILIWNERLFF